VELIQLQDRWCHLKANYKKLGKQSRKRLNSDEKTENPELKES
jgi:hypothetical protein